MPRASFLVASQLLALSSAARDVNQNCVSRGECIPTYPKFPDQHTLCLATNDSNWRCAALAGVWGDADWSFGPGFTRDTTMLGGMGVDLNETFTAHTLPAGSPYGNCNPSGALDWEITRELSYLNENGWDRGRSMRDAVLRVRPDAARHIRAPVRSADTDHTRGRRARQSRVRGLPLLHKVHGVRVPPSVNGEERRCYAKNGQPIILPTSPSRHKGAVAASATLSRSSSQYHAMTSGAK
jgi:hypothetical protein